MKSGALSRTMARDLKTKPNTGRNATAVQISPGGEGAVLDGLMFVGAMAHSANEVGFRMLSKIG